MRVKRPPLRALLPRSPVWTRPCPEGVIYPPLGDVLDDVLRALLYPIDVKIPIEDPPSPAAGQDGLLPVCLEELDILQEVEQPAIILVQGVVYHHVLISKIVEHPECQLTCHLLVDAHLLGYRFGEHFVPFHIKLSSHYVILPLMLGLGVSLRSLHSFHWYVLDIRVGYQRLYNWVFLS